MDVRLSLDSDTRGTALNVSDCEIDAAQQRNDTDARRVDGRARPRLAVAAIAKQGSVREDTG